MAATTCVGLGPAVGLVTTAFALEITSSDLRETSLHGALCSAACASLDILGSGGGPGLLLLLAQIFGSD